jgi:prephenate dehydrogenase
VARITIIGTGYVGTSIGLALKAQKTEAEIVGHDADYGKSSAAKKLGALDRAEWNLPAALEGAALVIVATPLSAIERLFSLMAEFLAPGCVVTDTASLKGPVLGWAETYLTGRVSYVGGNPIVADAGTTRKPSATIFQNKTYCIVSPPTATDKAIDQVIRFVATLGAVPLFLDPVEHDSHVAVVGQLPMILASTLMTVAAANPAWRDGQRLAGPSFGTATALALTNPAEQQAQLRANRETVLRWIYALRAELGEVARMLENETAEDLTKALAAAQDHRARWEPGLGPEMDVTAPELPRARDQFSSFFLGKLGNRQK